MNIIQITDLDKQFTHYKVDSGVEYNENTRASKI